jgi:2-polyprenyl-3-methyl-5-hydroxy-6-metoxy-1,4-benzoquinol methylase
MNNEKEDRALVSEVREIWDRNAAFWNKSMGEGNRFHRLLVAPMMESLLAVRRDQRILDLACGQGYFSMRLIELGATVVALDISRGMLELAEKRLKDFSHRIRFAAVDVTDRAALADLAHSGPFDKVVANMALMDVPYLEPMAEVLPTLITPWASFVISVLHPCFNMNLGCRLGAEEEDRDGTITLERYVRVSRYITPYAVKYTGIIGQPAPHYYFHRPLVELLRPFLSNGWVLDGLQESSFPSAEPNARLFSWEHYQEIPPVLAFRLRHGGKRG